MNGDPGTAARGADAWPGDRFIRTLIAAHLTAVAAIAIVNLSPLMGSFSVAALFDMNNEASVCVWLSSTTLFVIGALAGACAFETGLRDDATARNAWGLMALLFTALSLDETAAIHEHIGILVARHIGEFSSLPGAFMWVAVVAPVGLLLAMALACWFVRMPKSAYGEGKLALGALGVWFTVPFIEVLDPVLGAPRAAIVLEESMEFLGEALMLWALLLAWRHARAMTKRHLAAANRTPDLRVAA